MAKATSLEYQHSTIQSPSPMSGAYVNGGEINEDLDNSRSHTYHLSHLVEEKSAKCLTTVTGKLEWTLRP